VWSFNHNRDTDEHLMSLIARGDEKAFSRLYSRYFEKLVWYAFGFTAQMERAKDIVQEVFVKIIERPEAFDNKRKFSTWVYTVTGNACRNALRNEQNRSVLLNEMAAEGDVMVYSHLKTDVKLLQQQINNLLETLSEKERSIYLLRFEQELSIKEIAAILVIPEGSVKSCIYYLLKKLEAHLKYFRL